MSPRRLFVLLPPGTGADIAGPLVQAAARLAASTAGQLDIIDATPRDATAALPALPLAARWWHTEVPFPARIDAPALLAWAEAALAATDLDGAAPMLAIWPAGQQAVEEAAARLAHRLGAQSLGKLSDLALDGAALRATRAAWGGRAQLGLSTSASRCVACWRPAAAVDAGAATLPAVATLACAPAWPPAADATPEPSTDKLRPLEGAPLVVAGGRGLGEDGFALLADIAGQLDAALAGSLPSVDAGWVPVARQVGQSGKFVSPRIYFAVGISGTPQHLAGIATGSRIIAVNKDPDAAIFSVAQTGVVAEWQQLLPALARELVALKGPAAADA